MTVRADILSNIETVIVGLAAIQTVEVGRIRQVDLGETTLPAAFISFGTDEKVATAMGYETFLVSSMIEVWCKDTDVETLIGSVHSSILSDITRGGNALNTIRETCAPLLVDLARAIGGFEMTFRILYRHPFGVP